MSEPLRIKYNDTYFDDGGRIHIGKLISSNDAGKDWHDRQVILENTSPYPLVDFAMKTNMTPDLFQFVLPKKLEPGQKFNSNMSLKASKLFMAKLTDLYLQIDYAELRTY